jgi:hypothetical protein
MRKMSSGWELEDIFDTHPDSDANQYVYTHISSN